MFPFKSNNVTIFDLLLIPMGFIQKDALKTMLISYAGLFLGYLNKAVLFIWFLNTEQIGLVNLIVSIGLLFGNLAGLGSTYAIWKFFPFLRNKEKSHHGFLSLVLLVSLVGALFFGILAVVFQGEMTHFYINKSSLFVDYYYWIIVLGFASVFYSTLDSFLRSMYKNIISVIVYEIVLRLGITVIIFLLGFDLIDFDTFIILHCLFYFVPVLVLMIYMYRIGELIVGVKHIRLPRRFRKIILSFSLFSYVNSIGNMFVTTIDAMMIASFIGLKATGIYTTIIYFTTALQIPYKSLMRITYPLISDYWKEKDMQSMSELYKKFSSVNLAISMIVFVLFWISRNEIFSFLPKEFEEGMYVFLFLMIGKLFDMYMGLNGVIFVTSKKYKYDIIFTITLFICVIVFNSFLIPIYGMVGAAIATAIGFVVYNIGRLVFVWVVYKIHPFQIKQVAVFALSIGLLFVFEYIPFNFGNSFVTLCIRSTCFIIAFSVPFYLFNLEPEIIQYIKRKTGFLKKIYK